MTIFTFFFFITDTVRVFEDFFCSTSFKSRYTVYYAKKPSYLGKPISVSIYMIKNGSIDPNNHSGDKDSLALEFPSNYRYTRGITILTPTGRSLDAIIDIDC